MFESCPEFIEVEAIDENVEQVSKKLSGSVCLSGIVSISMSHWLLKFGGASARLRKSIASMIEWLANSCHPWVEYCTTTWDRLVGLDKCSGVRTISIGDNLLRLLCKVMLIVVGKEATRSCGTDQLYSGLEAGIEGGIHPM